MARRDTKSDILDAAGRIVLERGAMGLTLEAVADEAGLSKGGLLYHYASKEQLLTAMVARLIEATEQRIDEHRARDRDSGSWARGYLEACASDAESCAESTGRLGMALLAAGAADPGLLAEFRSRQATWRRRLHGDGIAPARALTVRLAADGLWLNDLFGLGALEPEERAAVLRELEALTRAD